MNSLIWMNLNILTKVNHCVFLACLTNNCKINQLQGWGRQMNVKCQHHLWWNALSCPSLASSLPIISAMLHFHLPLFFICHCTALWWRCADSCSNSWHSLSWNKSTTSLCRFAEADLYKLPSWIRLENDNEACVYVLPIFIFHILVYFFKGTVVPQLHGVIWRTAVSDAKETDSWSHPGSLGQVLYIKDDAHVIGVSVHCWNPLLSCIF